MLKKASVILILLVMLLAVMFSASYSLIYASVPDKIQTQSELVYYKGTDSSGNITERYEFLPSVEVMRGENGLVKPELLFKVKAAELFLKQRVQSFYKLTVNQVSGEMSLTANFKSDTDYRIANGETGFDKPLSGGKKQSSFFFSTYTVQTKTVWSFYDNVTSIPGCFYQLMLDVGEKSENIHMTYVFGTAYDTRAISTDADKVQKANGSYLHSFYMSPDTANREIRLVQTVPNGAGWYTIVLIAGFAVAGAGLAYYFIQKKRGR